MLVTDSGILNNTGGLKHSMIVSGSGYVTSTTGYVTTETTYEHIYIPPPNQTDCTSTVVINWDEPQTNSIEYKYYKIDGDKVTEVPSDFVLDEEPLPKYKVPKALALSAYRREKQRHQFIAKPKIVRRVITQRNIVKNLRWTHNGY